MSRAPYVPRRPWQVVGPDGRVRSTFASRGSAERYTHEHPQALRVRFRGSEHTGAQVRASGTLDLGPYLNAGTSEEGLVAEERSIIYALSPEGTTPFGAVISGSTVEFEPATAVWKVTIDDGVAIVAHVADFDDREVAKAFVRAWNGEALPRSVNVT